VTIASSRACVLSVMRARLFVKMPAVNSKTKTETIAISDIFKALFFKDSTSSDVVDDVVFLVPTRQNRRRPATINKIG
jgi:hypothetical protein